MIVGVTVLGFCLKRLWPAPGVTTIAVGAMAMLAAVPTSMILGAGIWLLIARHFVARSIAKVFFVHAGAGIFSRLSERMFVLAYGRDDVRR
jgi:hypothetical protein